MKKLLIILAVFLTAFTIWYYWKHPLTTKVKIGEHIFLVDLAVTPQEKERGLGGRASLAPDHGMLFVYDHREQYQFWMKGMRFPLDILWIADKTIISVDTDIAPPQSPDEKLRIYVPPISVNKVLELPAGTVMRTGIGIGDTIEILR